MTIRKIVIWIKKHIIIKMFDFENIHGIKKMFCLIKDLHLTLAQWIDMNVLKVVAFHVAFSLIAYKFLNNPENSILRCKHFLMESPDAKDLKWKLDGCGLKNYSIKEIESCFSSAQPRKFIFIGGSEMIDLFWQFDSLITGSHQNLVSPPIENQIRRHSNLKIELEFTLAPTADPEHSIADIEIRLRSYLQNDVKLPDLIVIDGGILTRLTDADVDQALVTYKNGLKELKPVIEEIESLGKSQILWMFPPLSNKTYSKVDFNKVVSEELGYLNKKSHVFSFWKSGQHFIQKMRMSDQETLQKLSMMLVNLQCNKAKHLDGNFCCANPPKPTALQVIVFTMFGIVTVGAIFFWMVKFCQKFEIFSQTKFQLTDSLFTLVWTVARLGIILTYIYICDRATIFSTEPKVFEPIRFWVPIIILIFLGCYFNEEVKEDSFMNRQQTEEWKGWMQVFILVYHWTGASQSLGVYMFMRVLVSSYLFLNGYGHFQFYWKQNTKVAIKSSANGCWSLQGAVRFLSVLVRMNLFTVLLCLTMSMSYQAYYFVPLISFWYTIQTIILNLNPPNQINSLKIQYIWMIFKIVGTIILISLLYYNEIVFESMFNFPLWRPLFELDHDFLHEWEFRWRTDSYSSLSGVLFGLIVVALDHYLSLNEGCKNVLKSTPVLTSLVIGSVVGLGAYVTFVNQCHSKVYCNQVHHFVAFVPIVSFLWIRNGVNLLSKRYSTFFAWFGKFSLELFIAQYHIWLASNTKGILVILPGYAILNLVSTTFLFILAAHEINAITNGLVNHIIPSNHEQLKRNLFLFAIFLAGLFFSYKVNE